MIYVKSTQPGLEEMIKKINLCLQIATIAQTIIRQQGTKGKNKFTVQGPSFLTKASATILIDNVPWGNSLIKREREK